jgi:hypothetical protein
MRIPGYTAGVVLAQGRSLGQVKQINEGGFTLGRGTICDCVAACKVVRLCILDYCTDWTVCSDCAFVTNCREVS